MHVHIKRIYDTPAPIDGLRVLVDRLWPRGLSKEDAAIDIWAKEIAPSNELRKWFGHDDAKCKEFTRRYQAELAERSVDVQKLITAADGQTMTLVYAAKNTECNNAIVLQSCLQHHSGTECSE